MTRRIISNRKKKTNERKETTPKTDNIGKYMIGMSVPPKMTEQVARAVIDQWLQPKP
jgi:hypothetical protein